MFLHIFTCSNMFLHVLTCSYIFWAILTCSYMFWHVSILHRSNSMTMPFPVLLSRCMPCLQMIILYCLRRSYIRCVDDLTISLHYRLSCNTCNNYLDSHLMALQNFFSSYNASSCLISFTSMTLPFSRLSCSVHLLLCLPACKWSSCIVYVDLIFVALTIWP